MPYAPIIFRYLSPMLVIHSLTFTSWLPLGEHSQSFSLLFVKCPYLFVISSLYIINTSVIHTRKFDTLGQFCCGWKRTLEIFSRNSCAVNPLATGTGPLGAGLMAAGWAIMGFSNDHNKLSKVFLKEWVVIWDFWWLLLTKNGQLFF